MNDSLKQHPNRLMHWLVWGSEYQDIIFRRFSTTFLRKINILLVMLITTFFKSSIYICLFWISVAVMTTSGAAMTAQTRELWWCQICRHWSQTTMPPITKKLASSQLSGVNVHVGVFQSFYTLHILVPQSHERHVAVCNKPSTLNRPWHRYQSYIQVKQTITKLLPEAYKHNT